MQLRINRKSIEMGWSLDWFSTNIIKDSGSFHSPSRRPQHVDFDFSFSPHGHKIVTVSLPTAPVWELSPSVSLAKKKHFSEAPTAAAPASPLWSHWWDLSHCVCDGYVTESHPWMEEAGLALRLGCWLGSDLVDDHWADSVETPTGMQC